MKKPSRPSRIKVGERYRRSPALVIYWTGSGPQSFDAQTARRAAIDSEVIPLVDSLTEWHTIDELARTHPELGSKRDIQQLIEMLVRLGLVQGADAHDSDWSWRAWSPEAAFFHFGTRDRTYRKDPTFDGHEAALREKARIIPQPQATKSMAGPRRPLPSPAVRGSLKAALSRRRTWRTFNTGHVPIGALATLLHQTFAVQRWGTVPGQGKIALKTSPSGGARHAIEAYLIALRVEGLASGVYHYDAATHDLVDLRRPFKHSELEPALAHQTYFLDAGALIVMSAVFERPMWRYPFSRAYRSILTEAGHLGQTFCLVATTLDLAPFCTMAFRDSDLEALIGVDGVHESAIYVVGAGSRPDGVTHPGRIPM